MIYLILPPKAEEGWIKPDQCQVNSTWLELTYYIEALIIILLILDFRIREFLCRRRYSDFVWLRDEVETSVAIVIPHMPPKG